MRPKFVFVAVLSAFCASSSLAQAQPGNVVPSNWQQWLRQTSNYPQNTPSLSNSVPMTRVIAPTVVKAKPGDVLANLRLNVETHDSFYSHHTITTIDGETIRTSSHAKLGGPNIYCVVGIVRNNTQTAIKNVKVTYRVGNDYLSRYGATGSKHISPVVLQPKASGVFSDPIGQVSLPKRSKVHLVALEWLDMNGTRYSWP